jgi:hypothetical protein
MKSALFVHANVAVNTKLTSKVPFLFGNFHIFVKMWSKTSNFAMVWREHFREKFFRCPFQYPKVPLEAPNLLSAPSQSFDAFITPKSLAHKF